MSDVRRIRLTLTYDGTAYAGWQRQANAVAVQQRVEEAIQSLTGAPHSVTGASRTDAGVHARGQVAHFDTQSNIPIDKWCLALNSRMPDDIRAVAAQGAAADFHARFHARRKRYTYHICNAPYAPAIGRQYAWHVPRPLDDEAMRAAAASIAGRHDFACCMAAGGESKTTVRTVYEATVERCGTDVVIAVEGDGFLYNMVRILAGTLCYVGMGKLGTNAVEKALTSGDRLELGPTAPANGLCLEWVRYDE